MVNGKIAKTADAAVENYNRRNDRLQLWQNNIEKCLYNISPIYDACFIQCPWYG